MARLTLIGLYQYDNSLFDNLVFPTFEDLTINIKRETAIDNILLRSGDFSVIYPDLPFLKYAIGLWSSKNEWTFEKWVRAINVEYNPLDNYSRSETHVASENIHHEDSGKYSRENSIDEKGSGNSATENQISAYDSVNYSNKDKTTVDSGSNSESKQQISDATESTHNETNGKNETITASGNIGVTTSQKMLKDELEIAEWNLYDQIAKLFCKEFCLMEY